MKAAIVVAVLMAGALASAAQATPGKEVLRFVSSQVSATRTSADTVVINNTDLINGKKVGHDTLTCKLLSQTRATCSIVITFTTGKLNAKFAISSGANSGRGTIIGGTGRYAGAKGSLTFKNLNTKGNITSVVVTLT